MLKKFTMENEVGIEVNYTVLARMNDYIVYTNYMPSDNELGIRLLVGKLESEEPFKLSRVPLSLQKQICEEFKLSLITSGRKLKRR